jgi:predicted HTH domain antitoxin
MATQKIDVPEEILVLLRQSRLGTRPDADKVSLALAIHLFQQGLISVGRAAEPAGEPRATFELLLADLGIPPVRYSVDDYRADVETIQRARGKRL